MMRNVSWVVLVLALVAVGGMPIAVAQTESSPYVVKPDDTVYALKGIYSSSQPEWKAFTMLNPFLAEPGRAFVAPDGRFIVLIRPEEKLSGVEQLGITVEPLPINELGLAPTTETAPPKTASETATADTRFVVQPWLFWLAFVIGVLVAAYLLLRSRNPGTAGEPVVAGGISSDQPDAVEQRAQQIADRRLAASNPTADLQTDRPERIGPIEEGVLNGWGRVQYRTGLPMPRHFTNEPAYRARFRFVGVGGREEELTFLQACANDVALMGTRYLGFTFTPRRAVVAAPQPTPSPLRPAPVALPAVAMRPSAEQVLAIVGGLRMMLPAGSIIRAEENGEVRLTVAGPCEIRVQQRAKRAAGPKRLRAAATGTAGDTQ